MSFPMSEQIPKAMRHGADTRYNLSELPLQLDPDVRARIERQAQSVACLVEKTLLIEPLSCGATQYHISPRAPTLADKLQTMFEESLQAGSVEQKRPPVQEQSQLEYNGPFKDELSIADGTAFLIGKQLILTAAHCVCDYISGTINKTKLASLRVLFGFQTNLSGHVQTTFDSKDVYRIESVWQYRLTRDKPGKPPTADWAILKLDREVEGRVPLNLTNTRALISNTSLYMLGYPSGLPLKLTLSGEVQNADHPHFFETDLDAYEGNSGAPVFAKDGSLVGMLLRGDRDYILRGKNIQISKISKRMIEDGEAGYEKCHKIASLDLVKTVLSSLFNLTHSHFSGRTKQLANLKEHLAISSSSTRVYILYGPSGVGKSELAIAFANQNIKNFSFIWHIDCGTDEEQFVGYQGLARRLGIPLEEKEILSSLVHRVQCELEKNTSKPWLLLFDNLQTSPVLPVRGGSVIITAYKRLSMQSLPEGTVVATEVLPLEPEEALKCLADVTEKPIEDCKKLLDHVGCYPLLLGQVATYIKHTGMEIDDYLTNLERPSVVSRGKSPKMVLEVAFGMALQQLSPLARQWLFLCSRLNVALIPLSYLKAWLDAEDLSEEQAGIISALEEYALLRYNAQDEVFSLHLEFQRILKSVAPPDTLSQVVHLLNNMTNGWDFEGTNDWAKTMKQATIWASHAKPVIEATQQMSLDDLERANLLAGLGRWEYKSGRYRKALGYCSEALKIQRAYLGWDHPDVARSLGNVGICYDSQGNYTEALQMHREALQILRDALGEHHLNVASSLNNIGSCYYSQGNYTEALQMYREALQIKREALGDSHPDVASSLGSIGNCYYSQGNYTEALQMHREALQIKRDAWGERHPDVASSLGNIGRCYYSQGNYTEALQMHREALQILRDAFGDNHPKVARALRDIERCQARLKEQQPKQSNKGRCIVS